MTLSMNLDLDSVLVGEGACENCHFWGLGSLFPESRAQAICSFSEIHPSIHPSIHQSIKNSSRSTTPTIPNSPSHPHILTFSPSLPFKQKSFIFSVRLKVWSPFRKWSWQRSLDVLQWLSSTRSGPHRLEAVSASKSEGSTVNHLNR